MLRILFVVPAYLLAACASLPAQHRAPLPADLQRVLVDYENSWRARDAAALSALFVDGAVSVSNSSACAPSQGRGEIARCYEGQGGALSLRAVAYGVDGGLGYIIGEYAEEPGGTALGKFVLTLEKGADGRWLIVADMDRGYRRQN
jgi:ketosteroid isomerase-like protein